MGLVLEACESKGIIIVVAVVVVLANVLIITVHSIMNYYEIDDDVHLHPNVSVVAVD